MIYFIPFLILITLTIRLITIANGPFGIFFFFLFCAFPIIISLILLYYTNLSIHRRRKIIAQIILLISCILYTIWYCFIEIDIHRHPDPQSGIVYLFVGIFAVPFLLPLWIIALFLFLPIKIRHTVDNSNDHNIMDKK